MKNAYDVENDGIVAIEYQVRTDADSAIAIPNVPAIGSQLRAGRDSLHGFVQITDVSIRLIFTPL